MHHKIIEYALQNDTLYTRRLLNIHYKIIECKSQDLEYARQAIEYASQDYRKHNLRF